MNTTKPDDEHIILEYFSGMFWNSKKCGEAIAKSFIKCAKRKNVLEDIDNSFINAKLFSFKKVLSSSKPEINILDGAKPKAAISYEYQLSDEEARNLFFGSNEIDKKNGGIAYNKEWDDILENIDVSKENDPEYSKSEKRNSLFFEKQFSLKLIFNFSNFDYLKKEKVNKKNPNHVQKINGTLKIEFSNGGSYTKPKNLGSIVYSPKRTENMNPPPSLKEQIHDLWNSKTPTDGGLAGLMAKRALSKIGNGLAGGLLGGFSKTVQDESFSFELKGELSYDNNIKERSDITDDENDSEAVDSKHIKDTIKEIIMSSEEFKKCLNLSNKYSDLDVKIKVENINTIDIVITRSSGDSITIKYIHE